LFGRITFGEITFGGILFGGIMRTFLFLITLACFVHSVSAQQPSASAKPDDKSQARDADSTLKDMFQTKIKAEWEALKNRDKKAYGELLAEDYIGVETDGRGERNKIQSLSEVSELNVFNYYLWGLKVTPLDPDAAFVVYEVTMQFPPRSQVRLLRNYVGELWVRRGGVWKELHSQETYVK
jgi:hypothetical protein